MKTAMQELLDELKEANSGNNFIKTTINLIIDMVESKLETEKQQIIDAYWNGHNQTEYSIHVAETYYTSTFTTNKETLK